VLSPLLLGDRNGTSAPTPPVCWTKLAPPGWPCRSRGASAAVIGANRAANTSPRNSAD